MAELCLVASHGYPPGFFSFHPAEQALSGKVFKDYQTLLSNPGLSQDSQHAYLYRPALHLTEDQFKPPVSILGSNDFFRHKSTTPKHVFNDGQAEHPDSLLFGLAKQFTLREKFMRLLVSGHSDLERSGIDLSVLFDWMERQTLVRNRPQLPLIPYEAPLDYENQPPLISLSGEFFSEQPILMGDVSHGSGITYDIHHPQPDEQVSLAGSRVEMEDVFSSLSELYSSKNSIKWKKLEMVVPYFDRRIKKAARVDVTGVSKDSLKRCAKMKSKASPKKKSNLKAVKNGEPYRNNSFRACESLLSVIFDKNQNGKTAIHSLRRSGPHLPKVLTQFSASIAGTGLAVLFSVVCKVACCQVPFCGTKLLSASLGVGLVWLSWAVNKLRDTVLTINKSAPELDLREDEILDKLDESFKEIYFRAAAILAVAVLRLA
ncbi:OLC1v1007399C1 [Oldenlandia corymbosa var. corymbosa]|uniref:OLC1v1007399C1 n=1 Tax=Oldenlandia corymbosa var. corymbosa TaxID=529605 RepID=A0AAV1DLI6_OLDCO|nr:OLC1v1007399C1 [Oldenlandia corymbosa var. corymbosa]